MLQVPIFGMENNPASLLVRREAFLTSYGYPIGTDIDEYTVVVGHVPYVPATDVTSIEGITTEWVRVTLYSSVVPYCRAWVKIRTSQLVSECETYERGNLWTVQLIEPIR